MTMEECDEWWQQRAIERDAEEVVEVSECDRGVQDFQNHNE